MTRADGRVQLSVTGKGERLRHVLLPAIVSRSLLASRGEAGPDAPVFASRKGGAPLYPRTVNRMVKRAAERAGVNPAISAHWLRPPTRAMRLGAARRLGEVRDTPTWRRGAPSCTRAPISPPGSCSTKAYFVEEEGGPEDGRP